MLRKGQKIPCEHTQEFFTVGDDQTTINKMKLDQKISVYIL